MLCIQISSDWEGNLFVFFLIFVIINVIITSGKDVDKVNKNILKIKLSTQTYRNPRILNERKTRKANEWQNWVIQYTIAPYSVGVLYGILSEKFLHNYCKYVNAI